MEKRLTGMLFHFIKSKEIEYNMTKIKRIIKRLYNTVKPIMLIKKSPELIILKDISTKPLKFNVYSSVERYRVADYGGEREVIERFIGMLEPTDVVYDIGASVGLFTISVASLLTQGIVYSFEPDTSTRARLLENIRLNQLNNVKIVEWAVSDCEGDVTLYTDGVAGFAPSFVLQKRDGAPTGQLCVPTCSIDTAISCKELNLPTVLKIDIEGAEGLCLKGCKRLLKGEFGKRPRILFLEIHPDFLPDFNSSADEIKHFMLDLDYELQWREERAEQEHLCYISSR